MATCPWNSNFNEFLTVLRCQKPTRPVLFELFFNAPYYNQMAGKVPADNSYFERLKVDIEAFHAFGFDYATARGCSMTFPIGKQKRLKTVSANDGFVITDWKSFEAYNWPDPDSFDYSQLEKIAPFIPEGMKLMVMGPGGVLENAMALTGYDNLCYMLYDEPELAEAIFNEVGHRLVRYYENSMGYDTVGVLMSNDDWGFNTQTFLSLKDMRRLVFPWHAKIVETAHKVGKPAILHSCGYLQYVMEDVIEVMKYDGRHSYEDIILPVEDCYRRWGGRIAILGGMDMDFMVRKDLETIHRRAEAMLALAEEKGGSALGTGNSVPEYLPMEHYLAMAKAAWEK